MSPIPKHWRPMTKLKKLSWYGNPFVRHVTIAGRDVVLKRVQGKPITKTKAKESAKDWREAERYARVMKVEGGYAVYVSGRRQKRKRG